MDNKERLEALFIQLVLTFQAAAWQQMGKIKNPLTDQIELDLDQARFSIDILEMLKVKTQGNLGESEERFLNHSLSELQLNYIAEFDKEKNEPVKAQEENKQDSESAVRTEPEKEKNIDEKKVRKADAKKKK